MKRYFIELLGSLTTIALGLIVVDMWKEYF